MKQLELKHITPYLPYKLKALMLDHESDYVGKKYDEIIGVHQWDKNGEFWSVLTVGGSKPDIKDIKPILRPISDLTKEIEHNGEKFIPSEVLNTDFTGVRTETLKFAQFNIVQKLLEWHFDVFGLIEQGLAIEK